MQLRQIPVVKLPKDSPELEEESEWIFRHAFCKGPISNQPDGEAGRKKGPQMIPKIKKCLEYIRCEHFEVPFIAFYRKEYTQPELNINDLWRIYKYDEKVNNAMIAVHLSFVILCFLLCSGASWKLARKILRGCLRKCAIIKQTNWWRISTSLLRKTFEWSRTKTFIGLILYIKIFLIYYFPDELLSINLFSLF